MKKNIFCLVLDNLCFDLVFPCPRMIPREATVLCGTEERQISHGHVSEARTSEKALFLERTDLASCLLPAFGTFLDEIYWICRRQESKISFALLLLTTVMMFVGAICVTNFYKDALSTLSVSKTSWKLWLVMSVWKPLLREVLYVLHPQMKASCPCTCFFPCSAALLSLRVCSSSQYSR